MWILKGILAGAIGFTIVFLIFLNWFLGKIHAAALGSTALMALSLENPFFWLGLLIFLTLGCLIFRHRETRRSEGNRGA